MQQLLKDKHILSLFDSKISNVDDDIDKDIFELSKEEIIDLNNQIESILDNIEDYSDNIELKRFLHTQKGSLKMTGFNRAGAITHRLESIIEYIENHKLIINDYISLLKEEYSKIKFLFTSPDHVLSDDDFAWLNGDNYFTDSNNQTEFIDDIHDIINNNGFIEEITTIKDQEKKPTKIIAAVNKSDEYIRVKSKNLDSIINDAVEIRLSKSSMDELNKSQKKQLADLRLSTDRIQQIVKEIVISAESQINATKYKQTENETDIIDFDPLEFDKFTRLQELTRFLAEISHDIIDFTEQAENNVKNQEYIVNQQHIYANNLFSELTKIRLIPFDSISDKFYQIVRKTSKELNKKINLKIEGEKHEIDKILLDRLFDPIAHLLRNGMFHGIEENRLEINKKEQGTITIKLEVEGNDIVFSISDDGKGLDKDKIYQAAIDKGLVKDGVQLTEQEIYNLIFIPGFSTVKTVSEVAGRGVGMEIVQTEVHSLGGNITIHSKLGVGTTFILSVPLSMANSQAMISHNQEQSIVIPTFLIENILSIKEVELEKSYNKGYLKNGTNKYPLYYLGHLMGGPISIYEMPDLKTYNNVLIINYNNETIALHVEDLINPTNIMIRSASKHLTKISGVLGTTLLGDGNLGLLINPILLKDFWKKNGRTAQLIKESDSNSLGLDFNLLSDSVNNNIETDFINDLVKKENKLIMVIDDSITVRKSTEKVLLEYGYEVIMAKNGAEALDLLELNNPAVILCDIEMPVMDGFDFLKNIRNNEKQKKYPIFMITSRTADKHKGYAMSLGANEFLGKPFQEKQLISLIRDYTTHK